MNCNKDFSSYRSLEVHTGNGSPELDGLESNQTRTNSYVADCATKVREEEYPAEEVLVYLKNTFQSLLNFSELYSVNCA
jgi:hypothetical protein